MRFDVIVGNPPYQDDIGHRGEQPPLYHKFYDNSINIANIINFITPCRFLFRVGKTPKKWNESMLKSKNFKVCNYFPCSKTVFPNVDVKGGVSITIYNRLALYKPIGTFIPNIITKGIVEKIKSRYKEFIGLDKILISNTSYRYSEELFLDFPEFKARLSGGSARYLASSSFSVLKEMFIKKVSNEEGYIGIYGRENNQRILYYTKRKYFKLPNNVDSYKLLIPSSMGSGKVGEILPNFIIGEPNTGSTETFISMGSFDSKDEVINLERYIKTKFARLLLSTKKVTQGNKTPYVWSNIPLQDFTSNSDIDWDKSIMEIDEQLFDKYGLTKEEREHIKESVKEMV